MRTVHAQETQKNAFLHRRDDGIIGLYNCETVKIRPFGRKLIETGVTISFSADLYGQVVPHNGLVKEFGILILGQTFTGRSSKIVLQAINLRKEKLILPPWYITAEMIIVKREQNVKLMEEGLNRSTITNHLNYDDEISEASAMCTNCL